MAICDSPVPATNGDPAMLAREPSAFTAKAKIFPDELATYNVLTKTASALGVLLKG
jgi:hypothetical protein